jgi:hypothetical protein
LNHQALPSVAGMHHEITFCRWHEQQRLPVCRHDRARNSGGRHDEAHFVTDGNPVPCVDSGRAIGSRCAEGEMDGEYEARMSRVAAMIFMDNSDDIDEVIYCFGWSGE